jgi:hypothetical protein
MLAAVFIYFLYPALAAHVEAPALPSCSLACLVVCLVASLAMYFVQASLAEAFVPP